MVRESVKKKSWTRRTRPRAAWRTKLPQYSRKITLGRSYEKKAIDTTINSAINTTGVITLINGCARGDALNERIGRATHMQSVYVRGLVDANATTGIAQIARVLIVYDRQANGVAPAITDILTHVHPYGHVNLSNSLRFSVIADQDYEIYDRTNGGDVDRSINIYRKLDLPVHYNSGDAGTVADITTGALYLIGLTNAAIGDTDSTMQVQARVRYTDA